MNRVRQTVISELSRVETGLASYGWVPNPEECLDKAMAASTKAVQLDERKSLLPLRGSDLTCVRRTV